MKYSMLHSAVIHRLRPYHLEDLDSDVSTTLKQTSGQGQMAGFFEQSRTFWDVMECHWVNSSSCIGEYGLRPSNIGK